ncbi:MAG TPA: hypothetical protein VD903_02580 [Pseudonocardia sp.]|nr:hypothetical protein [Pseudonocardia sp.]
MARAGRAPDRPDVRLAAVVLTRALDGIAAGHGHRAASGERRGDGPGAGGAAR